MHRSLGDDLSGRTVPATSTGSHATTWRMT